VHLGELLTTGAGATAYESLQLFGIRVRHLPCEVCGDRAGNGSDVRPRGRGLLEG